MSGLDAAILNKLNKSQQSPLIDEAVPLNATGDVITLPSGAVMLRTGTIETDIASYPDANVRKLYQYDGILFDVESYHSDVYDIDIFDADNYLTLDTGTDDIRRWSATGVALAYYPAMSVNQRYVVTDGTYVYGIESDGTVYQYPWEGGAGTLFTTVDVAGRACWDGTHFWMVKANYTLVQYTSLWVATGVTIPLELPARQGFTLMGGYWYLLQASEIGILTYEGKDTGARIPLTGKSSYSEGLGNNGSQICTCYTYNAAEIIAYSEVTEHVGDSVRHIHETTDYTYYVRIK